MDGFVNCLVESMCRYIGQTVTIFTTSGGLSGSGFTGVLVSCDCNCVRLLCDVGAPPACPLGSNCMDFGCGGNGVGWGGFGMNGFGGGGNCGGNCGNGGCGGCGNPFGSIAVIPTCAIACFTHNAL